MHSNPTQNTDIVFFVCSPLDSGSETSKVASPYRKSPDDNQHQNIADPQAPVEAGKVH